MHCKITLREDSVTHDMVKRLQEPDAFHPLLPPAPPPLSMGCLKTQSFDDLMPRETVETLLKRAAVRRKKKSSRP